MKYLEMTSCEWFPCIIRQFKSYIMRCRVLFFVFLVLVFLFPPVLCAQKDTTGTDMNFDFGLTRDADINLWPVFHLKKNKRERSLILDVLFPLYRYSRKPKFGRKHQHLLPFFLSDSSEVGRDFRLMSLYYPSLFRYQNNRTEGHTSYRFFELAPHINFLEYSRSNEGEYVRNNMFFFIWHKQDRIKERSHFVAFPLFWHYNNPEKKTTALPPLYFTQTQKSDYRKVRAITPLFWEFRTDSAYSANLFPLLYRRKNKHYSSFTFAPLLSSGKSTDGQKRHLMLSPFFWHFRDKEKYSTTLLPFIYSRKNESYKSFTFAPLFSTGQSLDNTRSHAVVSPLFWYFRQGRNYTATFIPFYRKSLKYVGENRVNKTHFYPLYYHYEDNLKSRTTFLPFYFYNKTPDYTRFFFIPFYSYGQNFDKSRWHRGITPFFWKFYNEGDETKTVLPLYWYSKKVREGDTRIAHTLFPLYWNRRSKDNQSSVLFPLVWNFENKREKSRTFLPFFSRGKAKDSSRSYSMYSMLYWHFRRGKNKTSVFFPFYWDRRKHLKSGNLHSRVVLPFYFSKRTPNVSNKVFFPFYFNLDNPKYRSKTVFPFYSKGQSKDGRFTHRAISPLYYEFKNNGDVSRTLFPFFWGIKKGQGEDQVRRNVIFPVYWHFKDKHYESKTVFPLWSYGRTPAGGRKHLTITPLLWHAKRGARRSTLFLPIFSHTRDSLAGKPISRTHLYPFLYRYSHGKKKGLVLFPFIYSFKRPYRTSLTVFPLFSYGNNKLTGNGHLVATPLFWNIRRNDEERTVLFPLIWRTKGSDYSSFSFLPFYHRYKDEAYGYNKTMLTPFFWHIKDGERRKNVFFPILWHEKSYDKTKVNVLPLFYYKNNRAVGKKHALLVPFLFHFESRKYSSTTVLPFFSYGKSKMNSNKHFVLPPLYWYFKRGENARHYVFPLFYHKSNKLEGKKRTVLFPLLHSYQDENYRTFTLFPFFSRGNDKLRNKKYLAVFPFYWSSTERNKSRKIFFPLFWQKKDSLRSSSTFAPFYHKSTNKQNNNSTTMFTPFLWRRIKGTRKSLDIVPLMHYHRDAETQERSFSFLYFLYRYRANAHRSRTSFLWPLIEHERDKSVSAFRIAPLIWYRKQENLKYLSIQPFYFHKKTPQGMENHLLWQFYRWEEEYNVKKSKSFLWKFLIYDKYTNHDREFRLLHLLYANMNKKGEVERSVFPFYHYHEKLDGSKSRSLLLYFYRSFKRPVPHSDKFYKEERIFWFLRLRSNYRQLKAEGLVDIR